MVGIRQNLMKLSGLREHFGHDSGITVKPYWVPWLEIIVLCSLASHFTLKVHLSTQE